MKSEGRGRERGKERKENAGNVGERREIYIGKVIEVESRGFLCGGITFLTGTVWPHKPYIMGLPKTMRNNL